MDGLTTFANHVQAQFESFLGAQAQHGLDHWQHSFELGATSTGQAGRQGDDTLTLVARGAELPGSARLLVFDDISEIVSAQRSQAWGEVARRLAHEIKNPLTPIQLSAERLELKLQGKLAPTDQALLTKSVKTIVDQVDAMKRLVNEFRDYARLPAAELKPVDLNALASDVLHLYANEVTTVPIQAQLDPACPPVLGDPQQLRQVLHNLLSNAIKYNSPNGWIRIAAVRQGGFIEVSIANSSPGILATDRDRIFERFYRADSARNRQIDGVGLGLSLSREIARAHGGDLRLVEAGEGAARFLVWLPARLQICNP
jgi:nitrogen fixation/metabolism regulation signal transduction histidine kinase